MVETLLRPIFSVGNRTPPAHASEMRSSGRAVGLVHVPHFELRIERGGLVERRDVHQKVCRRGAPARRSPTKIDVRVSFVVPAYTEASTIADLLERVSALALDKQIIVVDDGATDGTAEAVRNWAQGRDGVKFLSLQQNKEKV